MIRTALALMLLCAALTGCQTQHSPTQSGTAARSIAPTLPIAHSHGWITDADGRVLIVHGFNMVAKDAPYTLESVGFDQDDGAFLAKHGFNAVRLGFMWKASEPSPDAFDEDYLDSIQRSVEAIGEHGVLSLLDFHQDAYNEAVEGQGFPDWMVFDDGLPWIPGIPKEAQLAYQRVWDNFWANVEGPNATPLWDHFAHFWQHVAARFAGHPDILGYDLMNEPWPGLQTPACLNPVYCPHNATMSAFYQHVIPQIRAVDANTPIYYEGSLLSGGGMALDIDIDEPNAVLSFHNYCLLTVVGAMAGQSSIPLLPDLTCPQFETLTFDNAQRQAQNQNHPAVLTEFGSVTDMSAVQRVADQADARQVGWMHWTYFNTGTTNFPGTPSLVLDPHKPPSGDNINHELLATLTRPYPQLIAGTPQSWHFDPENKHFELRYSPDRVDGQGRFSAQATTIIFIPETHYPNGALIDVQGGTLQASTHPHHALVTAKPDATQVVVTITK